LKTAYFILGMHRSGTSALGGVLSLMGLELGTDIMKPNKDNPKGFFENNFVYRLNKKILDENSSSWNDYFFKVENISYEKRKEYVQSAKELIASEYRFSEQFTIKDPRICILFPIWEEACIELNIDIKIIIPYRNPLEVAQSLNIRNNFSYEKSLLLWSKHFLFAEYFSRRYKRIFLSFDNLLEDTDNILSVLEEFIDLPLNKQIEKKIKKFLDKSIKHNNFRLENFSKDIPLFLREIIFIIKNKDFKNSEKFDFLKNEFDFLLKLFEDKELGFLLKEYPTLKQELKRLREENNDLVKNLDKLVIENKNIKKRVNEATSLYTELNKEKESLIVDIKVLKNEKEKLYSLLKESKENYNKLNEFLELLKNEKKDLNKTIEEIQVQLKKRKKELIKRDEEYSLEKEKLSNQIDSIKYERDYLDRRIKEILHSFNKVKKVNLELESSSIKNKNIINLLEKEKKDSVETIKVLNKELEERKKKFEHSFKNIQEFYQLEKKYTSIQGRKYYLKLLVRGKNSRDRLDRKFKEIPFDVIIEFNEDLYLKENKDIKKSISKGDFNSGLEHFILFGFQEIQKGVRKKISFNGLNNITIEKVKIDKKLPLEDKKKINNKYYKEIKNSRLFDNDFYQKRYNISNGLEHYLSLGEESGFKPNELFDPEWYLNKNPDVQKAKMSPFFHYIKYGEKEGRFPSAFFNPLWYLEMYSDVANAKISPLLHYLKYGKKEGRLSYKYSIAKYNATDRKINRFMKEWDNSKESIVISNIKNNLVDISEILVSIVMPTYNREETIESSILSVLNQTHKNFELIIADDGSQDKTREIVKKIKDKRITYLYQENRGVSSARNLGLSSVSGKYIFFIDSDNRWKKDYLKYMILFMEINGVNSAYSAIALTDDFVTYKGYLGEEYDLVSLQKQNFIDLNCFAYKNSLNNYLFDESIGRLVDWDFILSIALDTPIYYIPFIGVEYFTGDSHARITNTVVTSDEEFLKLKRYIQMKNIENLKTKVNENKIVKIERIAIVLHLYNYKNIHIFLDSFKDISSPFDLYITTFLSSRNIIFDEIRTLFPTVSIFEYGDYGSDIETFLFLLPTLKHYQTVLKLHNNINDNIPFEISNRVIKDELIANKEHVSNIINHFKENKDLSIIGVKGLYIDRKLSSDEEKELLFIGKDINLLSLNCGYFLSSMFWINTDKLLHLFSYTIDSITNKNKFITKDSKELLKKFILSAIAYHRDSQIGLIENQDISISNDYSSYLKKSSSEIIEDLSENYLKFAPNIEKGKVLFFPDYRITNPYQKLMYDSLDKYYDINVGNIEKSILLQKESKKNIIFHLQWTSFIVNGDSRKDVQNSIDIFLKNLELFIEDGGVVVWTIHNLISHDGKFKDLEIELCKKLSNKVNYIHVHSQKIVKLVEPYYTIDEDKVLLGEHGSYIDIYPNYISREDARKKLNLDKDDFVFLFLGQIRPYKGVELLLSSFLKLEKDISLNSKNIKLLIVGKPVNYDISKLKRDAKKSFNIILELREIPDEELQIFFNATDFVVTPYKQILTSGSIYLALSYGLPIISPKKGIITEVLTENSDALLYDDVNNTLFDVMKQSLLLSKDELEVYKHNANQKSKKLTWNNMHEKLSKAFITSIVINSKVEKLKLSNNITREVIIRRAKLKDADMGIAILHYKHIDDTIRAIESVLEQKNIKFHLYVISNDENIEAFIQLSERFKDITTIQSPDNIGYAGGNNLALDLMYKSGMNYGLILNPDAVLPIGELAKLYQKAISHPDIGIMGPTIVYGNRPNIIWFAGAKIKFKNGLETEHINMGKNIDILSSNSFDTDYITGASILIKLDIISKIGLIPEEYFLYFEETDYCLNASKHNILLQVFPDVKVLHFKRSEEGGIPSLYYLYYFCRNILIMTLKYDKKKINFTEERIREKAQLWLKRIEKKSPDNLDISKKAINYGIKDGLNGIVGKVDLKVKLSQ